MRRPPASLLAEASPFAEEDDFFDLATELESELADDEEPLSLSDEEEALENIFLEFKKGIEQQLKSEDYDTHYNLGIAYKEMGLTDEAIGEFQLASKDPKRNVSCTAMLGLSFIEKGMPQLAIKWYRKGLEAPQITEDEYIGMCYDLALAYEEARDNENALKAYLEVYGRNTNYRDIARRIHACEKAQKDAPPQRSFHPEALLRFPMTEAPPPPSHSRADTSSHDRVAAGKRAFAHLRYDDAYAQFSIALQEGTTDPEAFIMLGHIFVMKEMAPSAVVAFRSAFDLLETTQQRIDLYMRLADEAKTASARSAVIHIAAHALKITGYASQVKQRYTALQKLDDDERKRSTH